MDWTELSNRLADGEKVYRAFQDGANAAAMLGSLERARNELQAQYDALPGQIEQAKADLAAIRAQATDAQVTATARANERQATFDAAHRQRVSIAQAELDDWNAKIAGQAAAYEQRANAALDQIAGLQAKISQLTEQVSALEGVKASMKTQLQSIA